MTKELFRHLVENKKIPDDTHFLESEANEVLGSYKGALNAHLVVVDKNGNIIQQFKDGHEIESKEVAYFPFHKAGSTTKTQISSFVRINMSITTEEKNIWLIFLKS
ncbi:MAG: hypothetical protein O2942_09455 [Proteobacteria bacterium]|nr:hypothetical protein [Pseudomonadota bacterium]